MNKKRIKIEKLLCGSSDDVANINNKSLEYMYSGLEPKIINKKEQEHMIINEGLVINIVDAEKSIRGMKGKIKDLEYHHRMTELGHYHEPMSWNEFRQWVLANPEVMDMWAEQYVMEHVEDDDYTDDDICWQKVEDPVYGAYFVQVQVNNAESRRINGRRDI